MGLAGIVSGCSFIEEKESITPRPDVRPTPRPDITPKLKENSHSEQPVKDSNFMQYVKNPYVIGSSIATLAVIGSALLYQKFIRGQNLPEQSLPEPILQTGVKNGNFLIISDVHSNIEALEAVLNDANNLGPFEEILDLGDNVGSGSSPNEVLYRLRAEKVRSLAGFSDCVIL